MYVCIYTYICIHMCVYVCIYIYIYIYIRGFGTAPGFYQCAILAVPLCLRRLGLFSTFKHRVFDKQITPG